MVCTQPYARRHWTFIRCKLVRCTRHRGFWGPLQAICVSLGSIGAHRDLFIRPSVIASGQAMVESSYHVPYAVSAMEGAVPDSTHLLARTFLRTVFCSTATKFAKHRCWLWTVIRYRYRTLSVRNAPEINIQIRERIHAGFECIHMHKSSQKANIFDPTPSRNQSLKTKVRPS